MDKKASMMLGKANGNDIVALQGGREEEDMVKKLSLVGHVCGFGVKFMFWVMCDGFDVSTDIILSEIIIRLCDN